MRKGEVLVQLDTSQEQAQLAAAEAQRELARPQPRAHAAACARRASSRRPSSTASQAESQQAEARVGEIRATIERKTIRAPFAGVLGIRQVNLGQYLNGGDPVVPLQSLDPIYVNFSRAAAGGRRARSRRRGARHGRGR